jgi:hypothetical protein
MVLGSSPVITRSITSLATVLMPAKLITPRS